MKETKSDQRKIDDSGLQRLREEWLKRRKEMGIEEPAESDLDKVTQEFHEENFHTQSVKTDVSFVNPYKDTYKVFISPNKRINFSFLFPSSWVVRETQGEKGEYIQVLLRGPRNKDDTFSAGIAVTISPAKDSNLEKYKDDLISRQQKLPVYRLIVNKRGYLGNVEAVDLFYAFALGLPLNSSAPKDTIISKRVVIFIRKGLAYRISCSAVKEDFGKFNSVFKNVVRTLEFSDEEDLLLPILSSSS